MYVFSLVLLLVGCSGQKRKEKVEAVKCFFVVVVVVFIPSSPCVDLALVVSSSVCIPFSSCVRASVSCLLAMPSLPPSPPPLLLMPLLSGRTRTTMTLSHTHTHTFSHSSLCNSLLPLLLTLPLPSWCLFFSLSLSLSLSHTHLYHFWTNDRSLLILSPSLYFSLP